MQIRIWPALLSIAVVVLAAHPAAHASRRQAAPVKKVAAPRGGGKTTLFGRIKPRPNGFKRNPAKQDAPDGQHEAVGQRKAVGATRTRPSVAGNVGWGAFFATLGTASAAQGHVLGALIGAGAAAYNGIKAWLIGKRGATVAQASSIAFNAGWGTFWSGAGVHELATGEPLAAAIGLGAGAYNLFKAARNTRALPRAGE